MSDTVIRKALDAEKLLEWLLDLYHGTGDRTEKFAYGRVEQKIESGAFDILIESEETISSLITTIESQKEEIENRKKYESFLLSVIRSGEEWESTYEKFLELKGKYGFTQEGDN